ncbi:MAG: hypothetical protein QOK47_106 [Actinomycetota bacterium]|jgi:hypothetical protein|nr:hypothetical protein [Actinomycetota bacterium]
MKRSLVLALAATFVVAGAGPALAVCAPLPPLKESLGDARAAFVGRVARTTDDDRTATVVVESIWLGPRLPQTVEVTGVPETDNDTPSLMTSEDRTYETGKRYLFVPENSAPPFHDNACTATTLYTEEVAALEPDGAIGPANSRSATWIGLIVALAVVGFWQTRRARRRAESIEV